MQDTLSIKPVLPAQIGATQLGLALEFSRCASSNAGVMSRVNTAQGLLSPTYLDIGQYPKSKKQAVQRSTYALRQRLSRVDATSGAVLATFDPIVKLTIDIPEGVTQAEMDAMLCTSLGSLLANNLEVFHQVCELQR